MMWWHKTCPVYGRLSVGGASHGVSFDSSAFECRPFDASTCFSTRQPQTYETCSHIADRKPSRASRMVECRPDGLVTAGPGVSGGRLDCSVNPGAIDPPWWGRAEKEIYMLVLSRKCGESVVLPDIGITITLVAIDGGRIRLGFEGPREVSVVRHKVPDNPGGTTSAPSEQSRPQIVREPVGNSR